jgi:hypothetical protein
MRTRGAGAAASSKGSATSAPCGKARPSSKRQASSSVATIWALCTARMVDLSGKVTRCGAPAPRTQLTLSKKVVDWMAKMVRVPSMSSKAAAKTPTLAASPRMSSRAAVKGAPRRHSLTMKG